LLHDHVNTLASHYLGSRETEDCTNPGDRVHAHKPPEISDIASSFQRHLEDDFCPTPSREIVATQHLVLFMTVNAVTVEAQATPNQLPDMLYNMEIFLVAVDVEARASEASKRIAAASDEGMSVSSSEIWEGKSVMVEGEKYLFLLIIDTRCKLYSNT
jgi:hypothetical protein